jgi:hypothetical protein
MFLVLLAWLVLHGPGAVSVDAQVKKWVFGPTAPAAPPPAAPPPVKDATG